MASLALHLKSHHRHSQILQRTTISNLKFSHLFSSSSSSSDDENINKIDNHFSEIKSKLKQQSQEQSNLSPSPSSEDASTHSTSNNGGEKSYPFSFAISEIKSKLKPLEQQQQHHHQFSKSAFGFSNVTQQGSSKPSTNDSIEKISQSISEFRRRSVPGSPSQQTSVFSKSNPDSNANNSFESIKQSLQNLLVKGKNMGDPKSLNDYGNNSLKPWRTKENDGNMNKMTGENLPMEIFGREISEKNMKKGEKADGEFWMMKYEHHELGKKLKELRPNPKENKGNWFSLSELKERLNKVKENAEKGLSSLGGKGINSFGQMFTEALKETKNDSKSKMDPLIHGFNILDPPKFMLSPPKEHLVEKYFHPDNLSAKDKLKLELKKVRDEFKMHESDYGSSRVQIAQLTTEILHLSSVLHKKDKHSRRGLQAKVQQRKKLLKYLRRTDWESYCFVLSKLGLRDNPDYKN